MKKYKNNNDLLFEIGSAVLVARSRCGFTQAQLAKKVGTFNLELHAWKTRSRFLVLR